MASDATRSSELLTKLKNTYTTVATFDLIEHLIQKCQKYLTIKLKIFNVCNNYEAESLLYELTTVLSSVK